MHDSLFNLLPAIQSIYPGQVPRRQLAVTRALLKVAVHIPWLPKRRRAKFRRSLIKSQVAELHSSLYRYSKEAGALVKSHPTIPTPNVTDVHPRFSVSGLASPSEARATFKAQANTSASVTARAVKPPAIEVSDPQPTSFRFSGWPLEMRDVASRCTWLEENKDIVIGDLNNRLEGVQTLSLDVFDTFLLRGTEAEATRFLEFSDFVLKALSQTKYADLVHGVSREGLTLMRTRAMQLTYRFRDRVASCNEGSILEVARQISASLGGDTALADLLIDLEIDFETTKLTRNPVLSDLVVQVKERGGRVILISDMYLHKEHIEAICQKLDPVGLSCIEATISSADTILNKRSGTLFGHVLDELDINPNTMLHVGDSFRSDVEMARKAGVDALHFAVSGPELSARQQSLADTVRRFDEIGIDATQWAKV